MTRFTYIMFVALLVCLTPAATQFVQAETQEALPDYLLTDLTQLCLSDEAVDYAFEDYPKIKRWFKEEGESLCEQVETAPREEVAERDPQWRTMSPWTLRDLEGMMARPSPELFTGGKFAQECWISDFEGADNLCIERRLELHRRGAPMSQQQYALLKRYCNKKFNDVDVERTCIYDWIEQEWLARGKREVPKTPVGGLDFDQHVVKAGLLDSYRPKPRRVVFAKPAASTGPKPATSSATSDPTTKTTKPARRVVFAKPATSSKPKPKPATRPAPAEKPKGKFGAVALSNDFDDRYGFVLNKATAEEAKRAALAQCGRNCYIGKDGVFTQCGALIQARHATAPATVVFWHRADTRAKAESVIRECEWQQSGRRCTVDASGCN